VISVPDEIEITDLHDVFLSMLGWTYDPGFSIRIHGQEFNSFQRRSRGKRLRDFQLQRQEKFLYTCDTLDLWEWEIRVLDMPEALQKKMRPSVWGGNTEGTSGSHVGAAEGSSP